MRGTNAAELAADIERQVSEGILQPGDRLPPVRSLAAELSLAPNTVAAAYRALGARGIVVGKGRNGTFISARPPVALPREPDPVDGLTDLSSGNPDPRFLPSLSITSTSESSVLYGTDSVAPSLRQLAVASFRSDLVPAEEIAVVSGALDGIERTLGAHMRTGDRIAVEDPCYSSVIDLLGALGIVPVAVEIDDEGMKPEALSAALSSGVSGVILTPRAQNPRGSTLTAARAQKLCQSLSKHVDILIIEDDHAGAVAGAPYRTVVGSQSSAWAMIRSAAKSYGPDLRVALMAGDPTTIRRVQGRQALGQGWVSHLLQRTLATLMQDNEVESALVETAKTYADRREALIGALVDQGVSAHGSSGLNVWIPVLDETAAIAGMRDRGFAVRGGERFRLRSGPGIRISTASLPVDQAVAVADAVTQSLALHAPTRTA